MNADRVIGIDGDLPWHYSADLKRFKQRTLNQIIVMGRLTWQSIGSKPLPKRRNVVLTSQIIDGVETYRDIDTMLRQFANDDLWFIGGGQIYRAAMDSMNLLDVTLVPDHIDARDTVRFPKIDPATWSLVLEQPLEDEPSLINQIYHRRG